MQRFTLGFSPCPNDCFIFDALVHKKIDTMGYEFEVIMEDVEQLNRRAFKSETDITKLSYHSFALLTQQYQLLDSGSALGENCGPLLIVRQDSQLAIADFLQKEFLKIAIPGKYTTANFLLSLAFPNLKNRYEVLFSEIEDQVLNGEVDAGLIIHESRFTYKEKGLRKILDLGEFWDDQFSVPIPLGGIVIRRSLPDSVKKDINSLIRQSVEFAFKDPGSSDSYVKQNAQEMDDEVIRKHIELYVNDYSISLKDEGRNAVKKMLETAKDKKIITDYHPDLFVI